jgi:NADH dehydrogenase [ubiquinone] 1 alpha subcomplex assembly factor 1
VALMILAAVTGGGMDGAVVTIVDFARANGPTWRSIDDVVMGGVSSSHLRRTDEGTALFEGELSLENNGGFASVRAATGPLDLSACSGIVLRVRGDGKHYRLRLRTDDRLDGIAYQAGFLTSDGGWQTLRLSFTEFLPTFRGRTLEGVEPLATHRIHQIGLMIADRQAGRFRLEVAWIRSI